MLFAIAGSQGSGKTTILNELANEGYNVIKRKTARSILGEYPGKSLIDIYNTPELCAEFHDKILRRKIDDEQQAIKSPDIWFTERTYADLFTYACMSLGRDDRYSQWLNLYYTACHALTQVYAHVFYIHGGQFQVEVDGVRGSNQYYSKMIDSSMLAFTQEMVDSYDNLTPIATPDLQQRVSTIITMSDFVWKKRNT